MKSDFSFKVFQNKNGLFFSRLKGMCASVCLCAFVQQFLKKNYSIVENFHNLFDPRNKNMLLKTFLNVVQ